MQIQVQIQQQTQIKITLIKHNFKVVKTSSPSEFLFAKRFLLLELPRFSNQM